MGTPVDQPRPAPALTRLGSHEILRKLARGGMAELFLARATGPEGFEKLVVLKRILPKLAENQKFVKLFLDEAKLAAGLDHPNIAHVHEMGLVDGHYFFTMEYVHGQDVRATLRRTVTTQRKFPLEHAVQIARNVAGALHYAHERRRPDGTLIDIVHRDVSPSNILLAYDGIVKLVDFGVAKAATSTVKTRTGTLKGKISYMSPEQAKGGTVDRRSDIFSLGIVLWEMVTTQRLFKADNDLATIQMIVNAKVEKPTALRPECSPELERVVLRALEIDPDKRYQTAEELQLELEELAREQKLNQSTVALRSYMTELFRDEITAWKAAQASGQTLTDHVLGSSVVDKTTPISESELELDDDDEVVDDDDEDDDASAAPTTMHKTVAPPVVMTGEVTQQAAPLIEASAAAPSTVVVARVDPTPLPVAAVATPFPIAPKEWRPRPPTEEPPPPDPSISQFQRKVLIGSAIGGGLLVIAIIASQCSSGAPTTKGDHANVAAVEQHETAPPPAPAPPQPPQQTRPPPTSTQPPAAQIDPQPEPQPDPEPEPQAQPEPDPRAAPPAHAAATPKRAPPPSCDAAALASEGRKRFSNGQYAQALASFDASIKCKPDASLYAMTYLTACRAGASAKIAHYYKLLPAGKVQTQACLANHLDPATGAPLADTKPADKTKPKKFDPNALDP